MSIEQSASCISARKETTPEVDRKVHRMPGEKDLHSVSLPEISAFWHRNRSPRESTALANLLKALNKVAGHLGKNVGDIEYLGMSKADASSIIIDPAMVMGEYPVPFEKVDYLVGIVVHEGLHQMEWSDHVWKLLEPKFRHMGGLVRVIFQKIIHFGEDIYVDRVADQSIFGEYTRKARKRALRETKKSFNPMIISVEELMYIWWATTFGQDDNVRILPVYEKPLAVLQELVLELNRVREIRKGVTARCEKRSRLYLDAWQRLENELCSWKVLNKQLYWYPDYRAASVKQTKQKNQAIRSVPGLNKTLVRDIQAELACTSANITPIIQSVAGFDNEDVAPMSRWDFNIEAHPVVDKRQVTRIKSIFLSYARRNKVINRGLRSGKVDPRRLYRAPVTGKCFRQVDRIPTLDWNVTLLLDASGSMRAKKWRMVESTVACLHKALLGHKNCLDAYAYFEMNGICMLSRLLKNNRLLSVPPSGQTASGQAIIAAAYFMPKDRVKNLLIHVTDGESNFGCDVRYGIDYCSQENIHLVTIGVGHPDREVMLKQYGRSIQFLDHYGQLAKAIENLLKWTFLYGTNQKPESRDALNAILTDKNS